MYASVFIINIINYVHNPIFFGKSLLNENWKIKMQINQISLHGIILQKELKCTWYNQISLII